MTKKQHWDRQKSKMHTYVSESVVNTSWFDALLVNLLLFISNHYPITHTCIIRNIMNQLKIRALFHFSRFRV